MRQSPSDNGRLELIARRLAEGEREILDEAELSLTDGLVGDDWRSRESGSSATGSPDPNRQLMLMNNRMAQLVAQRPNRRSLAGDQLYVDLDLSVENLLPGTRLSIGDAVIELTGASHLGCAKFVARFGQEAMRFVNSPSGRSLRLRGAAARVVQSGTIRTGDLVRRQPSAV